MQPIQFAVEIIPLSGQEYDAIGQSGCYPIRGVNVVFEQNPEEIDRVYLTPEPSEVGRWHDCFITMPPQAMTLLADAWLSRVAAQARFDPQALDDGTLADVQEYMVKYMTAGSLALKLQIALAVFRSAAVLSFPQEKQGSELRFSAKRLDNVLSILPATTRHIMQQFLNLTAGEFSAWCVEAFPDAAQVQERPTHLFA